MATARRKSQILSLLLLGTSGKGKYILGKTSSLTKIHPILNNVHRKYGNSFSQFCFSLCGLFCFLSALQEDGGPMFELIFFLLKRNWSSSIHVILVDMQKILFCFSRKWCERKGKKERDIPNKSKPKFSFIYYTLKCSSRM